MEKFLARRSIREMLFIILTLLLTILLFKIHKIYNFWKNKKVVFVKPWPIVGNFGALARKPFVHLMKDLYDKYPEERYVGIYLFLSPALLLRDPELIKQITIKEFESFPEHLNYMHKDNDPCFGSTLMQLQGSEWKRMRSHLSPVFSSGKIKMMFSLMLESAETFNQYLLKKNSEIVTLEMEDTAKRYLSDVIANTVFGITCDSLTNRQNEIFRHGDNASDVTGRLGYKIFTNITCPALAKFLNITIFDKNAAKFFGNVISETMKLRKEKNIFRPDLIHLFMELQNDGLKREETDDFGKIEEPIRYLTDQELLAHGLTFFTAGTKTQSITLWTLAYELALNQDVQEQLIKEVDDTLKSCQGEITYEALSSMKYLDMVFSEVLRKWPPGAWTDRLCVKPFTVNPEKVGERPFEIEPGMMCIISVYALHRDPRYFPNPEKFDPERFNDYNKTKIPTGAYIPFGLGPRYCIGSRFSTLVIKTFIFHVLARFQIVPVKKTQIPLVLSNTSFFPGLKTDLQLGFKKRFE